MENIPSTAELLIEAARRTASWGKSYSGTKVGAAVRAESGMIYTGANLSNASPSLTVCAERMAVQKASSEGEVGLAEVALYSPDYEYIMPCGLCRQVLIELAVSADMLVWVAGMDEHARPTWRSHTIGELLPYAYVSRRAKTTPER